MHTSRTILLALGIVTFAVAGTLGWFLYDHLRDISPRTYARWLDVEPRAYANVDPVPKSELQYFAYAYDENKFANALPGATRLPKIADSNGYVPAFKLGDDIFVITWKWVNASAGLALSESPEFKRKIESLDHHFRIQHLSGSIYQWDLDLDTPYRDENDD